MTIGIIPARMGSSRFPGKPLAPIHGVPMVGHCYFRARMSRALDATYIATCDTEIGAYAASIGAPCVMTSPEHTRASDRIAEAMLKIEDETGQRHDIVVLIQGDEPMLTPAMINAAVDGLASDPDVNVVNLMAPIDCPEDFDDANEVKVVVDSQGYALYFSREPIPSRRMTREVVPMFKQIAIIPFRRDYLLDYNRTPPTPLEKIESVDMLRLLENGHKIRMVMSPDITYAVDTPDDLAWVEGRMADDPLRGRYS
jgi:3-deoxy-manno-octulosonate cytidylyltransferase (CMP-KDO synthetase)